MREVYLAGGLEVVRCFQKLPLFDLVNQSRLLAEKNAPLDTFKGGFGHLPFDDALYLLNDCVLVRVADLESIHPSFKPMFPPNSENFISMTVIIYSNTNKLVKLRFVIDSDSGSMLKEDSNLRLMFDGGGEDKDEENNTMLDMARLLNCLIKRLSESSEHLVVVTPDVIPTRKQQKTSRLKPWLREDLPRVIMLDLKKAKQYGHRGPGTPTGIELTPHQRRGHWRTLRHERFGDNRGKRRWMKPVWVGDREWVSNGNHYKVVGA